MNPEPYVRAISLLPTYMQWEIQLYEWNYSFILQIMYKSSVVISKYRTDVVLDISCDPDPVTVYLSQSTL